MVLPARATPARPRVLIVEDHRDILELLACMLERAGFDIEKASNGRAAIELATAGQPFDVVVLDVNMSDVDGVRIAVELRGSESCRRTRIAFTLSSTNTESGIALSTTNDFLRKPFDCDWMVRAHRAAGGES